MIALEKFLFSLFLFLFPFNIKKFLTSAAGIGPITETNALFLYLSDILLILILLLWLMRNLGKIDFSFKKQKILGYVLGIFIVLTIISCFYSQNLIFNFYRIFHLSLGILLFFYLKTNFAKIFDHTKLLKILTISGVIQALIVLAQYLTQSSIGLKLLGESVLNKSIAGVAKIDLVSDKIIRAYGTFPHPNILAGFLLLCFFSAIILIIKTQQKDSKQNKNKIWLLVLGLLIIILGLFLTFSRTTLILSVVAIVAIFTYLYFHHITLSISRLKINRLLCLIIACFLILGAIFWPQLRIRFDINLKEQAVSLRIFYNQVAYEMIKKTPLTGVGIGNFINKFQKIMPGFELWQYQPVHNIYLLIFSEIGIFGLIAFLLGLYLIFRNYLESKIYNLELIIFGALGFVFLLIGAFDHFFFTINQGILMFWLVLGVLSNYSIKKLMD